LRDDRRLYRSPLLGALVSLAAVLTILQYSTLPRMKEILLSAPGLAGPGALVDSLTAFDIVLASAAAVIILAAAAAEIRGRTMSRDFALLTGTERGTLAVLTVLAAAAARFYLAAGEFALGDSLIHMSRTWAAAESIASGAWPHWSFYNYCGFPLLTFYSPGFFALTGSLSLLTGSADWTVKAVLFVLHAGSAFPVYYWARALGATRASALLSGAIVPLSFLHTHTVIWTGALPVSAIFLLIPLALLSIERILRGGGGRWAAVLAAATALSVLSHHGYAAYGLQLAALYLALRLALPGKDRPGLREILRVGLAVAAGLLLCAFFLYPVLTQSGRVYPPEGEWMLRPSLPGLAFLRSLLVWRNIWSGWTIAYIGLSVFILFLAGVIRAFAGDLGRIGSNAMRAAAVTALFALFCAAGRGRVINLALPFMALLAGAAVTGGGVKRSARLAFSMLLLVLADLGPTTIQSPFRTDRSFIREGLGRVASAVSPERVLTGYHDGAGWVYPHWRYNDGAGIFQPTGFFTQGAPRMINTVTAVLDELNSGADSLDTALKDELYLLNVAGLVMRTREEFIAPLPDGTSGPPCDPPISWILPSSPLLYSDIAVSGGPDSLTVIQESGVLMDLPGDDPRRRAYRRLVRSKTKEMGIDRENAAAGRIFLWPGQAAPGRGPGGADGGNGSPGVSINRFEASLALAEIDFRTERNGWVRASFSWYPGLRAFLDGEETGITRTLLGACAFRVPSGEHRLVLRPEGPQALPGLAGLILGLAALGAAARIKNHRRPVFSK
jgi:hypothetical protein